MPPTRREQLELDELLSDIYRGIEALPDKQQHQNTWAATSNKSANSSSSNNNNVLFAHSYVKEYELPGTSPIVRRHKQEIAKLRSEPPTSEHGLSGGAYYDSSKQPARSTLKRHTPDPYQSRKQPAHQQLAEQDLYGSQRTPTTPDNKRRVRIVDHRDNRNDNDGYSDYTDNYADDFASSSGHEQHQLAQQTNKPQGKVKYVNTNKLIYHQERNPEDRRSSDSEQEQDNVDGVTRVEYYHTTWLDRQLGRASKRRSSKELNERQVKEKAMIEELKRSLKNGAITLRQSLRGGRKHKDQLETFDDQILDAPAHTSSANRYKQESVFGSGLATIPRNYNKQSRGDSNSPRNKHNHTMNHSSTILHPQYAKPATPKQTTTTNTATTTTTTAHSPFDSVYRPVTEGHDQHLPTPMQTTNTSRSSVEASANYSRTLPHNYHHQQKPHSLLQSHLRGGSGASKVYSNPNTSTTSYTTRTTTLPPNCSSDFSTNSMRNPQYQQQQQRQHSNGYTTGHVDSTNTTHHQHYSTSTYDPATPSQHQAYHQASTISSIPSATEVVRSALSRSSSQVSLNQLNKTINLLPSSPTMDGASPMTPTKHLRPASPSLSPSPVAGIGQQHQRAHSDLTCSTRHPAGQPGTAGRLQQERHPDGTIVLHGTRTIAAAPQPAHIQQQQQQHGQPIYANPHASFIQHRAEQQMRQPGKSQASIREFNELDSLLRSLSPHGSSVHVTPGYSSRPAQGPIGFDYAPPPSSASGMVQPAVAAKPGSDIYARVQKPPQQQQTAASMYGASQPRQPLQQQQQHYAQGNIQTDTNQPFTIDVTSKRDDDCLKRQDLSEFEPPFELLPSMEDYQNITKLNPVKNHYWYKPNMSRDRAISLLKDKPQGTFIVRDSTSFRGAYGLAVKVSKLPKNVLNNASLRNPNGDPSAEYIRHFLIEPTSNGVRLKGYANEPVFGSLPSLIYQHSLTELALPCKLVIPRADIEDPHFNHKQKQFYDEFLISKEQAKHGPYERTTPMGGYRKYPGDVYVHNEHRIIFE